MRENVAIVVGRIAFLLSSILFLVAPWLGDNDLSVGQKCSLNAFVLLIVGLICALIAAP